MIYDLQKASLWKRIAAWLFDGILTGVLAVGFALLLSALMGYSARSASLEAGYAKYEQEFGVTFNLTQEEYLAMDEAARANYDAAYDALLADEDVIYTYNMVMNQTLIMTSCGILLAILALEFFVPLWFGNGQTLGKKIFGLCVIRTDGVQMNNMQLFVRTILGKFTIETMIPVYILMLLFFGSVGLTGTMLLFALMLGQGLSLALTRTNSLIHDLLAGTVVADFSSQMIFRTTEDLISYQKQIAADRAARKTF